MTFDAMSPGSSELVVDVRELSFSYGGYQAVRGIDLQVGPGQVHGLLGTNGAGKTTTLELLQGFRVPSGGRVRLLGVDPRRRAAQIRQNTGVVLQEAGFYQELSVRDTVAMWADLSSRVDDIDRVIDVVGLLPRNGNSVSTLSGGEKRRLDLALAIWGDPRVLILDEPTTGLDPESRSTLWEVVRGLRESGTTIILTTHYLEEVEVLADTVSIMHAGQIAVAGTIEEVLNSRPSRIQAEVQGRQVPSDWPPRPPAGVAVRWEESNRVATSPVSHTVHVSSRDQQRALTWLLNAADRSGVRFQWIRATPASLEEVFLDISSGRSQEVESRHGCTRN